VPAGISSHGCRVCWCYQRMRHPQSWLRVTSPPLRHHLCMQAFKNVLDELHAFPNVHIVVATREAGLAVRGVGPSAVVVLARLSATAAMDVLQFHLGPGCALSAKKRAAAEQLVEVVEGNPLVLSIAGGLVQRGELTLTVCLHGGSKRRRFSVRLVAVVLHVELYSCFRQGSF
jgi:hypothetical protein